MNNTPEILEEVKDALKTLCTSQGWTLTKSEDPNHLFDILYQQTGSGVCVVNYDGDNVHQQVSASVINKTKFSVAVSSGRDLTAPFDNKVKRRDGKKSLLEIIAEVKRTVLGLALSNGLSDPSAHYEGTQPLSTPEGLPLDAYKVSWWCYTADSQQEIESSSSSESSSSNLCIEVVGGYAGVSGEYVLTQTDVINGIEFTRWAKGSYEILADYSEGNYKWLIRNGNAYMYWVSTGSNPVQSPAGLTFNVNTPYRPAPTLIAT